MRRVATAIGFVLVCQAAGVLGVLTTETGASSWYVGLAKPAFQPPGWVFGPVWVLLYTLMGVAAWRVHALGRARPGVRAALALFAVQLALNAAWSPIFFGAHLVGVALGVLVLLLVAVALTTHRFARLDRAAGALMVPYLLWVAFATVLNAAILAANGATP